MHKKVLPKSKNKEKYKFLAVVVFFLLCGIVYSMQFHSGTLEMGTAITADEFGKPAGKPAVIEVGKIDLNTATAEQLTELSGIGQKRAEDIVIYREENEAFHRIEDIMNVSGIGEKTFEEIKDKITVGE